MATRINKRFLFDISFFDELLLNKKEDLAELAKKLTYISSKASGNKKKQNIMPVISREELAEKHKIAIETIKLFINKLDEPPSTIEKEKDEITRSIKYAFHLTYFFPYEVVIFTSEEKIEEYKSNEHYKPIRNISFISGESAMALIEYWFRTCRDEKLSSCE